MADGALHPAAPVSRAPPADVVTTTVEGCPSSRLPMPGSSWPGAWRWPSSSPSATRSCPRADGPGRAPSRSRRAAPPRETGAALARQALPLVRRASSPAGVARADGASGGEDARAAHRAASPPPRRPHRASRPGLPARASRSSTRATGIAPLVISGDMTGAVQALADAGWRVVRLTGDDLRVGPAPSPTVLRALRRS